MTEPVRKRGRPPKAAQTVEEALRRYAAGDFPSRPRNEVERLVFGRAPGRQRDPSSKSVQAGIAAAATAAHEGVSMAEAARRVAAALNVHVDTVRKYARAANRAPAVILSQRSTVLGVTTVEHRSAPLLHYVEDA